MKNIFKMFSLCVPLLLAGCSDGDTSNNAVPDNFFNQTATLQGTIFDAVDGSRLGGTSLKVTLVQGTLYRSPNVLKNGATETTFAGDYAYASIPISLNNQTEYRIVVTRNGYQQFEAAISFDANAAAGSGTLDKNYNYVGNIYMYPLGATANDVTVRVTAFSEPVEGATVLLNPNPAANNMTADNSNIYQNAQNGFLPSLSGITDASGEVVFAGTSLVLGGNYDIDVLPLTTAEGTQLARSNNAVNITIGTSIIIQNVAMADVVPGTTDGLYVVSASNTDPNNVTSSGVLTLTLSRAISLVDETTINASLANATTAALDFTGIGTSVTATVSVDGLVLTLSPNFVTPPEAFNGPNATTADNALFVNYGTALVRLTSANDTGSIYNVFALIDGSGGTPSPSVLTTPNF